MAEPLNRRTSIANKATFPYLALRTDFPVLELHGSSGDECHRSGKKNPKLHWCDVCGCVIISIEMIGDMRRWAAKVFGIYEGEMYGGAPIYTYLLEIYKYDLQASHRSLSGFLTLYRLFSKSYATLNLLTLPLSKYHKHIFPNAPFYSLDSELSEYQRRS